MEIVHLKKSNKEAEVLLSESVVNPEEFFERKIKNQQLVELKKGIFEALYEKNPRWYEAITITYVLEKPQKEVASCSFIYPFIDKHSRLIKCRRCQSLTR